MKLFRVHALHISEQRYGLDQSDLIPSRKRNVSLRQQLQTVSGAYTVSYLIASGGSFLGEAAGV
jgi:hypothetical protein